jgi:tRNA nucleotidyltransferase (CCA-adding enzyme)
VAGANGARFAVPRPVAEICERLRGAGHQAFLVGGCVRDLIIGRAAADFDVATSARPEDVARVFRRTVPTGLLHGTVTVLCGRDAQGEWEGVEVTTFRGEGPYSDARRPDSVRFVPTIEEDLSRRDLTINAIAYDPVSDRLVDPHGGERDLRARVIRAVGDALERFREDGLRPLRAVRLAAVLGFEVAAPVRDAIPAALASFRKVAAERVRDELLKMLAAPRPSVGLELMRETGLLREVLPELLEGLGLRQNRFHALDVYRHALCCCDETKGDPVLRLAALLHDVGKPRAAQPRPEDPNDNTFYRHEVVGAELADGIARRLKLSTAERERVVGLVRNHMFFYTDDWSPPAVRRFIRKVGQENLPDLFALRAGDVLARGRGEDPEIELGAVRQRVEDALRAEAALKITDLALGGAEVMRILGIGPGPRVGQVLRDLLERVIEDPSQNTAERLEALVRELGA